MRTRQKDRRKVEIAGQCCTADGRLFDIAVRDLTDGGCRFGDLQPPLRIGEQLNLMIGGSGPHRAHVRWSNEGAVGVSFARPFTKEQIEQLIAGDFKPAAESLSQSGPVNDRRDNSLPLRSVC